MSDEVRAQPLDTTIYGGNIMQPDEEIQYAPRSRPVSFYDNFKDVPMVTPCVTSALSADNLNQIRDNGINSSMATANNNNNNRVNSAVSTGNVTKIQNPKVTGPQKFLPPLVYHWRLGRCLAALQTILGVAITVLSLWLLLWAPHLPITDNPYWSGMPLLLSGSFGICLLCCFKKEYPGMSPGFCLTSTKVTSVFLAILATVTCSIACVFSAIHLARLMGLECNPARVLNATCVCKPRESASNSTETAVRYIDLNCPEVESILTILLIFSITCNALGAVVTGWYTYLHWSTRHKRPKYMQVRTNPISGNNFLSSRPIYNPNLSER
ncbi:Sarcospan [Apis cerana cerana]|uniref:Sarcospan n=1 Tax=Apis cerana cerana TaxID=94128 RepID=A0A2A3EL33_APICC|nr:Sarcospan [Apis cerana cerana]